MYFYIIYFCCSPILSTKYIPNDPYVYPFIYLIIYPLIYYHNIVKFTILFFYIFIFFTTNKNPYSILILQGYYLFLHYFLFSIEAFTKSLNRGWLLVGLDLNSGWNCTATNHGWSFISTISTSFPSGDSPVISIPFFSMISL